MASRNSEDSSESEAESMDSDEEVIISFIKLNLLFISLFYKISCKKLSRKENSAMDSTSTFRLPGRTPTTRLNLKFIQFPDLFLTFNGFLGLKFRRV